MNQSVRQSPTDPGSDTTNRHDRSSTGQSSGVNLRPTMNHIRKRSYTDPLGNGSS